MSYDWSIARRCRGVHDVCIEQKLGFQILVLTWSRSPAHFASQPTLFPFIENEWAPLFRRLQCAGWISGVRLRTAYGGVFSKERCILSCSSVKGLFDLFLNALLCTEVLVKTLPDFRPGTCTSKMNEQSGRVILKFFRQQLQSV